MSPPDQYALQQRQMQEPAPQPQRSLQQRTYLKSRPGYRELFDPAKHYYADQNMRHKDYISYNDTYAAQKAFWAISKLEKSGANLRYWTCLVRPLVLPSPVHYPYNCYYINWLYQPQTMTFYPI